MRLQTHRPYGQVFGMPGVHFQQDGHWFRKDGSAITDAPVESAVVADEAPDPAPPTPKNIAPAEEKRLRAQMDIYGEAWQGIAHARRFLEGKA